MTTGLLIHLGLAILGAQPTTTQASANRQARPVVKLGRVPTIKLAERRAADPAAAEKARRLIARLKDVDKPDYGISATMSGQVFAPIADSARPGAFLRANHNIKPSEVVIELVKMGPHAMPHLLAAIDDLTHTGIVINHDSLLGGMWHNDEMTMNPVNETERKAFGLFPRPPEDLRNRLDNNLGSYTVKVGDVCFVIIGQIVGRRYQAVRYQPSMCVVLNSPTHNATIANRARAIWHADRPREHLLQALLLDYSTQGIYDGKSFDGWYVGSSLQVQAAMRLLYYFPKETAPLIAARLRGLKTHRTGPGVGSPSNEAERESWVKREVYNGVRTDEFVKAVSWCGEPAVRAQITAIFERTRDPDILVAALPAVTDSNQRLISSRFNAAIDALPVDDGGPFGDGFNLLVAFGKRGGDDDKVVFKRYLDARTVPRCRTTCHALRDVHGEWASELLGPLLDDTRLAEGWNYATRRGSNEPRLPIRICDEAAKTIAMHDPDLSFEMVGTHANLDRQIAVIRAHLRLDK